LSNNPESPGFHLFSVSGATLETIDANGNITVKTLDGNDRTVKLKDRLANVSTVTFDPAGKPKGTHLFSRAEEKLKGTHLFSWAEEEGRFIISVSDVIDRQ
jgi:hypothetical protein